MNCKMTMRDKILLLGFISSCAAILGLAYLS